MILLAFETATPTGGVALLRDGKLVAETVIEGSQRHSQECLAAAEAMLSQQQLTWGDIDMYCSSHGPGAFTGVRVGLSLIKGLAFANGKQCVTVDTLEALAFQCVQDVPEDGCIAPMLDARMDEVYAAIFRVEGSGLVRIAEDRCLPAEELLKELPTGAALVGLGVDAYRQVFQSRKDLHFLDWRRDLQPSSTALLCYAKCQTGAALSPEKVEAIYLRHPVKENR